MSMRRPRPPLSGWRRCRPFSVVLALACGAPLIDLLLGRAPTGETAATPGSRGWRALVALTSLCFLATLVNPYGVRLYAVVLEFAVLLVLPLDVLIGIRARGLFRASCACHRFCRAGGFRWSEIAPRRPLAFTFHHFNFALHVNCPRDR